MTQSPQFAFQPKLYFLVGSTAVGKTSLSLQCARELDAEIVSCDSLCVYRRMDIGTAKPTPEIQAEVPHHAIDLVEPSEQYTVGAYYEYVTRLLENLAVREKNALVVGGSGFYLKSFFEPVVDRHELKKEAVEKVADLYETGGLEALQEELKKVLGQSKPVLDWQNPRRVAKALERCWSTGRSLEALQAEFAGLPRPFAGFEKRVCLLKRSPEDLKERVRLRVDQMFEEGLIEEVEGLLADGFERNPSAARAIGYRETIGYLREGGSIDELKELIAVHTDQLIRKQRIWFRRQIPIHFEVEAETATPTMAFP